jgi:hypothetical protein
MLVLFPTCSATQCKKGRVNREAKEMEEISLEYGGVEPNRLDNGVVLNPNDASRQRDCKIHHKAKRTRGLIGVAMSVLSHLMFVLFTIYVTYICFEDYSLFSWHPICMTVGVSG